MSSNAQQCPDVACKPPTYRAGQPVPVEVVGQGRMVAHLCEGCGCLVADRGLHDEAVRQGLHAA